jgi:ABC-type multidrug transport system fused ATPase/permease subunit
MMGMNDVSYWISYIITDGFILGFMIALVCSLLSLYGLFNDGEFYVIFFMIYSFTLSMISVAFFVSSFFDNIGSAGNASLGLVLGSYVCYIAFDLDTTSSIGVQSLFSLFPPIAFQIACGSFKNSYVYEDRLSTYSISCIMIADFFIFSILSWYVAQIFPSEFGIKRPWWFIFNPNYWFPNSDILNIPNNNNLFNAENSASKYPTEIVDENKIGTPAIKIQQIKKTFGNTSVVNGVSVEMYENQIFALLGHNGAGKLIYFLNFTFSFNFLFFYL